MFQEDIIHNKKKCQLVVNLLTCIFNLFYMNKKYKFFFHRQTETWKIAPRMNSPKCAFAATSMNNKYIYVFGGFDGQKRLNTIEKFDETSNKWTTLEIKLKSSLSNAAAVQCNKD